MTIDGDAIVVVKSDQFGETQRACQSAGLVADTFHHAAVAEEDVGAMIDNGMPIAIELLRHQLFRQGEAHRIADTLTQRSGGGFHAGRDAVLGVARSLAVQLTEGLQLAHR